MYPWELKEFIEQRSGTLGGDDLLKATSPEENPQLNHILYDPFENKFKMWDKEGNYYEITPIPYEQAKEKGLVKKK